MRIIKSADGFEPGDKTLAKGFALEITARMIEDLNSRLSPARGDSRSQEPE